MKKTKVCFVVDLLRDGGAQRSTANLSKLLEDRYDISYVVFASDHQAYEYGGKLYDLNIPSKRSKAKTVLVDIKRIHALRKLKKQIKPDITISSLDGANIASAATPSGDVRLMILHTALSARHTGRFTTFRSKWAYRHADKVAAVSKLSAEDICRLGWTTRDKAVSIYNFVDSANILNSDDPGLSKPNGSPLIVSMGSLSAQKSMWNLIRAFKRVLAVYPEAHLMIFGGGRQGRYTELIEKLGLSDNITLEGYVINPHHLMKQADLFILPSRFEGMPNALLEAMSLGLPIISTDSKSGPREILAPDTDILSDKAITQAEYGKYGVLIPVPKGDFLEAEVPITPEEEIMADTIVKLFNDKEKLKYYSDASIERVKDFSPEKIKEEWITLLDSIEKERSK